MEMYKTLAGERIDKIVHNYYGDIEMLSKILAINPSLSQISLCLEADLEILLPKKEVIIDTTDKGALLW
jgi:phage tail protein X